MTINEKNEIVHQKLCNDLAYQYSVENSDIFNMMTTLKAHGLESTFRAAELQVQYGQIVLSVVEYNAA
jgi:hypothetical protein